MQLIKANMAESNTVQRTLARKIARVLQQSTHLHFHFVANQYSAAKKQPRISGRGGSRRVGFCCSPSARWFWTTTAGWARPARTLLLLLLHARAVGSTIPRLSCPISRRTTTTSPSSTVSCSLVARVCSHLRGPAAAPLPSIIKQAEGTINHKDP